jgi:transcriptional antiterminator RfaH
MKYHKLHHYHGEKLERQVGFHSSVYRQPAREQHPIDFGWYCVRTKSGAEELAKKNLERQGFEVYLPMTPSDLRKQRVTLKELEPLFRTYLFLHLSEQVGDWSPIKYTIGVLSLVRFGGFPARVPEALIRELRERENQSGVHVVTQFEYQTGDEVVIRSGGSFEYCKAIFQKSAGQRVWLLMDILGRETEIQMLRRNIEPAS